MSKYCDAMRLVIVGGGCAGYSAAVCAARNNVDVTLITGNDIGGQLAKATVVDNVPGFNVMTGDDFMDKLRSHALEFGTNMIEDEVTYMEFNQHPFRVLTDHSGTVVADRIIIATGKSFNSLNIGSEKKFIGRGVSYCVTCDGRFYKNRGVCVVGSGDSAVKAAIFLSKIAHDVKLLVRGDRLKASAYNKNELKTRSNIDVIFNTNVIDICGDGLVEYIVVDRCGKQENISTDGVFVMVGSNPNTELFNGFIELDERGYIITDDHCRTNIKWVYAAGDVQSSAYKQAPIAMGNGYTAAMACQED